MRGVAVLVIAAALTLLWALAAAVSNHSGFTILAIAMVAVVVPLATAALAAEHPSVWAGILAGSGGGSGTTTYAENIGVMAATKIYSTAIFVCAAVIALLLGFLLGLIDSLIRR